MALSLPPLPGPGPSQADVLVAIRPGSGVTIDSPGPDVVRDLAVSAEALRVVVGAIRTGVLTLESTVAAINTGDLSGIQAQLSDKASVASVTGLAQSIAQLISDAGTYARIGQIPTTPGEVGADPAGAAATVQALVTATYATKTEVSDGFAGKVNVATFNTRQNAVDTALAARPTLTDADARYAATSALGGYAPLVNGVIPQQYIPAGSGGSGTNPTVVDGGGASTTSTDTIDGGGAAA